MHTKSKTETKPAERTAAEWLVLLEAGDADEATRGAFLAWLRARPENEADFELCEAIINVSAGLARDEQIVPGLAHDGASGVSAALLAQGRRALRKFTQPGLRTALAAFAVVSVVLGPLTFNSLQPADSEMQSTGQSGGAQTGATERPGDAAAQREGDSASSPLESLPGAQSVPAGETAANQSAPDQLGANRCSTQESPEIVEARLQQVASLETQMRNTKVRLEELRLIYTDRHPDVIAQMRALDALEAQLSELRARSAPASSIGELLRCVEVGRAAPAGEVAR